MSQTVTLELQAAYALIRDALIAQGVLPDVAQSVATALVDAEADGQVGHGFSRLADYAAQARSGKINPAANITCQAVHPASLLIDADCGFAYPALDMAVQQGIKVAQEFGIASMAVTNSHHCGSLSLQVEKLAAAGLIGIMVANSPPAIAPAGGSTPIFGTNPIAFAVPRSGADPLVIDMSLSVVARGKVMNAARTGASIPEGWALDPNGHPTTDPEQGLQGSMVPIGGAKGTALALMVEVLSALLTGANFSFQASSFFAATGPAPRVGQYLLAIKPMQSEADFAQRFEALIGEILKQDGTRLSGASRFTKRALAHKNGLTIAQNYHDIALKLAAGQTT